MRMIGMQESLFWWITPVHSLPIERGGNSYGVLLGVR